MLHIAIYTDDIIEGRHLKNTVEATAINKKAELIIDPYDQFEPLLYMLTTDMVHYDMVILTESDGLPERILHIREKNPDVRIILIVNDLRQVYPLYKYKISGFVLYEDVNENLGSVVIQLLETNIITDRRYCLFDIITLNGICYKQKIAVYDILYISVKDKIITMHTSAEELVLKEIKLDKIAREMTKRGFIYIDRSHIVNISRIDKFSGKTIVLDNDEVLEISRRQQKNVEQAFINQYIKNRKEEIV